MASTSCENAAAEVCCKCHSNAILGEDCHAGDTVCSECGLVVSDQIIDVGSEWKTFSNEKDTKDASRIGAAKSSLLEGGDLSKTITKGTGDSTLDANGRPLHHNRKTVRSSDRHPLSHAFQKISTIADRLNLPEMIVDRTNVLFKDICDGKSMHGRSYNTIATSCLYAACRQGQVPRTLKEICEVSESSQKPIRRALKRLQEIQGITFEMTNIGNFIPRFCSNLQLSNAIQEASKHIAHRAEELKAVHSKSPISVAAAAIYMASQASKEKKMAKDIGDISGVAESTIHQLYNLMLPHAEFLFPEDFKPATIL